jgi:VWFA-related protein
MTGRIIPPYRIIQRLAFFFIVVLAIHAVAQEFEVTVTTVTVWVRATDKSGKPVTGLTQADFEISEDGKRVEASCFEEAALNTTSPAASEQATPPATESGPGPSKQIVFLIDQYNTSQQEFLFIKKKVTEFLENLAEYWNVSLVHLVPGLIQVSVENTREAGLLQSELERISANPGRDIAVIQKRRELSTVLRRFHQIPRKNPEMISESCNLAREYALEEKSVSLQWLHSLKQFDGYIKKQPPESHKVVLFFSGGISSSPGKQYFDLVRGSDLVRDMVGDEYNLERDYPECSYEEGYDLQNEFKKLVGQLNRYNITFYNVSSRGPVNLLLDTIPEGRQLKASDFQFLQEYQDFLAVMAQETGGLFFGNSLNFKKGFDGILNDLNHQYLLCYKPPVHKKQGYHSINVKSKKSGVKLRYRSGYFD